MGTDTAPPIAVVTLTGNLPTSLFIDPDRPPILVTTAQLIRSAPSWPARRRGHRRGVRRRHRGAAVAALRRRGLRRILSEGGPTLLEEPGSPVTSSTDVPDHFTHACRSTDHRAGGRVPRPDSHGAATRGLHRRPRLSAVRPAGRGPDREVDENGERRDMTGSEELRADGPTVSATIRSRRWARSPRRWSGWRARGHLYEFHQQMGRADLLLGEGLRQVALGRPRPGRRPAGRGDAGPQRALRALDLSIVEEFDDNYWSVLREHERSVRGELTGVRATSTRPR